MDDETNYHPFFTSNLAGQTALVLSPHQDDESLACGGALALHAINGDQYDFKLLNTSGAAPLVFRISC
jgi:LmbE family N-acetylglucosaminyl deacetylase